MLIGIVYKAGCDVMSFEFNLSYEAVFPTRPKYHDKNLNTLRLPLLCERLDNMLIGIVYKAGCDVMSFEFNLSYEAVFPTRPKYHDKNLNTLRTKKAFSTK